MSNQDIARIIQISDTHIFDNPDERFDGVDTYQSLKQVIEFINNHTIKHDCIVVTGDLVHQPSIIAYERLLSLLTLFKTPVYCLPGNHDNPSMMHQCLNNDNVSTLKQILFKNWQVVLLDSHKPESHAGYVKKEEFEFLNQCINNYADKHVILAVHHPSISIHSSWMDSMMMENATDFLEQVQRQQIKSVTFGHVHQQLEEKYEKVIHLACPSTCVQFKPKSNTYQKDLIPHGFRQITLFPDASLQTEVYRLT